MTKKGKTKCIHLLTRLNICRISIKTATWISINRRHAIVSREMKSRWEIISIVDKERKEKCKFKKTFQNNLIAEPLTNNEINKIR